MANNTSKRLQDLERALQPKDDKIIVWIVDYETGEHTRSDGSGAIVERLSPEEWEVYKSQPGCGNIIEVVYEEKELPQNLRKPEEIEGK